MTRMELFTNKVATQLYGKLNEILIAIKKSGSYSLE